MIKKRSNSEYKKWWRETHREQVKESARLYRIKTKEKRKAYNKLWKAKHPEGVARRRKIYQKKRLKNDICFKLKFTLYNRLRMALKGNSKKGSAVKDLGCSVQELKIHLEKQFKEGMNWGNYGFRGWHIDHIIPMSFFDLTDQEQLLKAVHYTNLQPMWAKENWAKGMKLDYPQMPIDKHLPLSVL